MKTKITGSAILILIITLFTITKVAAQNTFTQTTVMTDPEAYKYANEFKARNPNVVSGGVITRQALDQILSNSNNNAITYRLCMDTTGTIAPANAIFIVLSGATATERNGQVTIVETGTQKYAPKNWCPPNCMKFMIKNAAGILVPME